MDKLKGLVGGQKEEEPSLLAQVSDASTLSWSTRIKGFGICFGLGVLLSIIGSITLFFGNLTAFAFLYSFGNILSIASTVFLMGPVKQIKRMLDPNRLIATCLVFLFLGLTLCAALWLRLIIGMTFNDVVEESFPGSYFLHLPVFSDDLVSTAYHIFLMQDLPLRAALKAVAMSSANRELLHSWNNALQKIRPRSDIELSHYTVTNKTFLSS
ncbi:Vesicle transport protein SFT2B [Trichoplax sp. H2]|nr:Vesicle transport protein SFT2B [Trichoplax sp. H2]|eukprot:RDD46741.1 Vesicle transport protein SFT2B [Trichoplax sp. H2]